MQGSLLQTTVTIRLAMGRLCRTAQDGFLLQFFGQKFRCSKAQIWNLLGNFTIKFMTFALLLDQLIFP